MNPRRSKSVKLVSKTSHHSSKRPPLEVEVDAEDPRMSTSAVYCCIARGRNVVYRYSSSSGGGGGKEEEDPSTESVAALCLEHAPAHHRHYIHTSGTRSYAFLSADGHTFFAIIDPCVGNAGALQFLERVRDVFLRNAHRDTNNNGFRHHDSSSSLVPAVRRLAAALEKMPRAAFVLRDREEDDHGHGGSGGRGGGLSGGGGTNDTSSSSTASCTSSSKVPLLGKSGSRKEKKKSSSKDKGVGDGENETGRGGGGVRIDMPTADEATGMSLERSASQSQSRLRRLQQPSSRSLWMRHVRVIIVVDAVICLLLFAAWLAVCKGFQCVTGSG